MLDIALLTNSAWTLLQPHLATLGTQAAAGIAKQVPAAVQSVWNAIQKRFDTKPAAKEALEEVLKNPEDVDSQGAFRQQLKKVMQEDNTFAADLEKLLKAAGTTYKAELQGDGAIAQGTGAKAVGKGGILVDGSVSGSNIISGNNNVVSGKKKSKK